MWWPAKFAGLAQTAANYDGVQAAAGPVQPVDCARAESPPCPANPAGPGLRLPGQKTKAVEVYAYLDPGVSRAAWSGCASGEVLSW